MAYCAMLYAARAALSEEDRSAKTHAGAWSLFKERFVDAGRFPAPLYAEAHAVQRTREAADYDAATIDREEAAKLVALAERFVAAVETMLA